jgi:hypothetical protein
MTYSFRFTRYEDDATLIFLERIPGRVRGKHKAWYAVGWRREPYVRIRRTREVVGAQKKDPPLQAGGVATSYFPGGLPLKYRGSWKA